jgi:hypothetical protein
LQVAEIKEQQIMAQRQLSRQLSLLSSAQGLSRTASAASADGGAPATATAAPAGGSRGPTPPPPTPPDGPPRPSPGRVFGAGGPFSLLEQLAARANAGTA